MPRYYCDYCDTYLTHDSPSVRKQHNAGYKHKANVRTYYQKFEEQQTQAMLDQRIKERLGQQGAYPQIGAAYTQHLAAFPGQPPRMPMMPLPIPGAPHPHLVPGMRHPILPRPVVPGAPVYSVPPGIAPVPGQLPGATSLPMQPTSLPMQPNSLPMQPGSLPNPPHSAAPVPGGAAPATNAPPPVSYSLPPPPAPAPAPAPENAH